MLIVAHCSYFKNTGLKKSLLPGWWRGREMSCWNGWDVTPECGIVPGMQWECGGASQGVSLLKPGKSTQWEDETANKSWGAARKQDRGAGDPSHWPLGILLVSHWFGGVMGWAQSCSCQPQLCWSPCPSQVAVFALEAAAAPGEGGVLLFEIREPSLAPSKAAASREEPSRKGMSRIMGESQAGSRAVPLQGARSNTARTWDNTAHEQKSSTLCDLLQSSPCWPKSSLWAAVTWFRSVGWCWFVLVVHL